jgi:enamine deaminase RidA (YjgF/YER057c/UK114 family)
MIKTLKTIFSIIATALEAILMTLTLIVELTSWLAAICKSKNIGRK